MTIETLANAFVSAGAALGEAMSGELERKDPTLAAKVAQALQFGERLQLSIEFDPVNPLVRLATLDQAGNVKRVAQVGTITVGGRQ